MIERERERKMSDMIVFNMPDQNLPSTVVRLLVRRDGVDVAPRGRFPQGRQER